MNSDLRLGLVIICIAAIVTTGLYVDSIIKNNQSTITLNTGHKEKKDAKKETEEDIEKNIEENKVEEVINFTNYDVPSNNTIKSYMDYRCITSITSNQYKLQHTLAYTGDYGLRMVNGRYCVALGSYYSTTIGQYVDIELKNGNVIHGILADCKADGDTDSTNRIHPDGSVVEFVVDTDYLDSVVKVMGDVSYVNDWYSKVANIKVYDKVEDYGAYY